MYEQSLYKVVKNHIKSKTINRLEEEKNLLEDKPKVEEKKESKFKGFAERRSK